MAFPAKSICLLDERLAGRHSSSLLCQRYPSLTSALPSVPPVLHCCARWLALYVPIGMGCVPEVLTQLRPRQKLWPKSVTSSNLKSAGLDRQNRIAETPACAYIQLHTRLQSTTAMRVRRKVGVNEQSNRHANAGPNSPARASTDHRQADCISSMAAKTC